MARCIDDRTYRPMQQRETAGSAVAMDFRHLQARSSAFYVDLLGFEIMYRREDPPFMMLRLGRAQIMLEQIHTAAWITDEMHHPFGRGINLEIEHPDPRSLDQVLAAHGVDRFRPVTERVYDVGERTVTQIQVLVQDPDGYLLRFACEI